MNNQILTERPKGMDFDTYKKVRRNQKNSIRRYLKGRYICLGQTFIGSTKLAKFI